MRRTRGMALLGLLRARLDQTKAPLRARRCHGWTVLTLSPPTKTSGRRAQARGDAAEAFVEQTHASAAFVQAEPDAWFIRRYARKVVGAKGVRFVAPQGPDFGGGVVRDGRAVPCEIEVKLCERTQLKRGGLSLARLDFERFTEAELRYLGACARAGGIAVVLVLAGVHPWVATWHAVPWRAIERDVLAWMKATPAERTGLRASVSQKELDEWTVRRETYLRAEWLR